MEQEYFSDGVTEEIIAHLSQLKDIRVVSRTSVLPYKGKGMNITDIASELNVQTVLEGSVRRSGNKVRITAQLINASTDEHLWTEVYDQELSDIFEIQSSVARSIAEKFEVNISPETNLKIQQPPTQEFEAYDLFLQARRVAFRDLGAGVGTNTRNRLSALEYLNEALALDPGYAQAMALKSMVYSDLGVREIGKKYLLDSATDLAKESIIHNPDIADGYIALGESVQWQDGIDEALPWFERAAQIDPSTGLTTLAEKHIWYARMPGAIGYINQKIDLDPNSFERYELKARVYTYFDLEDSVQKYLDIAKRLNPQAKTVYLADFAFQIFRGDFREAHTAAEKYFEEDTLGFHKEMGIYHLFHREWKKTESHYAKTFYRDMDWGLVLWHTGRRDSARVVFQNSIAYYKQLGDKIFGSQIGRMNAVLGQKKMALRYLENDMDQGSSWLGLDFKKDPFLDPIRDDPDFIKLKDRFERERQEMLEEIREMEKGREPNTK